MRKSQLWLLACMKATGSAVLHTWSKTVSKAAAEVCKYMVLVEAVGGSLPLSAAQVELVGLLFGDRGLVQQLRVLVAQSMEAFGLDTIHLEHNILAAGAVQPDGDCNIIFPDLVCTEMQRCTALRFCALPCKAWPAPAAANSCTDSQGISIV